MPYLNISDDFDERPDIEALSDAEFHQLMRDICHWSRTGLGTPKVAELLADGAIRRAPRHWLPDAIKPPLRYRAKISAAVRSLVYERDGWRCRGCGATERLTLDHVIPWSVGGSDDEMNLQTLCQSCNSRKGARA